MLSLRNIVDNFHVGLNTLVNTVFLAGSSGSQIYADAAIDSFALHFLEGTASDDGEGTTKFRGVLDPPADPEVIKWYFVSPFRPLGKLIFLFKLSLFIIV